MPRLKIILVSTAIGVVCSTSGVAQQLEPRAYAPIPVGVNVVGMPFVYQTGAVVTDPSLPVQNVDAEVELLAAFYDRTFSFFGRSRAP